MASLSTRLTAFKNDFSVITECFLQASGLPFASVLNAEWIEQVFREEEALFGQDDLFSTQIVLWSFLTLFSIPPSTTAHKKGVVGNPRTGWDCAPTRRAAPA